MIKNIVKHFKLITKHKFLVFKICIKAGIPFRGFMHDWSKYSITEFWESIKYYKGTSSPISESRRINGYSLAWLHHKGRNKHHYEYWYDPETEIKAPVIPYKYAVEMVCDRIAASMTYNGKNYNQTLPLDYWLNHTPKECINEKIQLFLTKVFTELSENGIDATINSKNLKRLYKESIK